MIFSVDEKQVIYSNIYTNDIVFFDYKAQRKLNVIKGKIYAFLHSKLHFNCYLDTGYSRCQIW